MKSKKKIVLAYSGGLDTSIILKWLQENYDAEVICYTADVGQEIDRKKIIKNAKRLGVKNIIIENLKDQNIYTTIEIDSKKNVNLVLTGNYAKDEVIEAADLVTEMREIKHPFQQGIKAKKGIDF